MTPLCELAKKYQTDKGGEHLIYGGVPGDTCHNYTPAYYELFKGRQNDVRRVLEIGVNAGGSLRMWEEFFPNAYIVGLDIRPEVLFDVGRIRGFVADQGNEESLLQVMEKTGYSQYDLIVDDGSHEFHHQILSARTLLPFLGPEGIYVIEDIHIDCKPEIVMDQIPPEYVCEAIECPNGIGKAKCGCGCGGPENLIVIRRR